MKTRRNPIFIPALLFWVGAIVISGGVVYAGVKYIDRKKVEAEAQTKLELEKQWNTMAGYGALATLALGLGAVALKSGMAPARLP